MSNSCPYCDAKLCPSGRIWECDTELYLAGMKLEDVIKQSDACRIRELEQQNEKLEELEKATRQYQDELFTDMTYDGRVKEDWGPVEKKLDALDKESSDA